jgi:hypothetical protein
MGVGLGFRAVELGYLTANFDKFKKYCAQILSDMPSQILLLADLSFVWKGMSPTILT